MAVTFPMLLTCYEPFNFFKLTPIYLIFVINCPSFDTQRRDLLAGVLALIRPFGLTNPSNEVLTQLLMYGNKDFPDEINRNILELTLHFIHETGRFD